MLRKIHRRIILKYCSKINDFEHPITLIGINFKKEFIFHDGEKVH